ncbi:hypothetical protein A3H38_02740 [candidate division WOR-1 bacterium RIFCSPLOWO2_02_FULL_46_20]|uniref:Copper resistance protein B n=1 Tax=candidate division WOR-1 bacterium RIFCSPLOWO2_02_FULL_46_20 TaxID=1802567 RepID=A0A1F4R8S1_UNCSA|nr:MAG: hypothetical protein A3J44_05940 [candidate division WOR-1 bacterium RIFCSPHIGHO2_02_FULL_45_12]OGC04569.1 MAG: hypothetical protein A3H38_02740 [candidate division WOR-1 bacterium RIFCSPLOWO2_02_FULL_46_20]
MFREILFKVFCFSAILSVLTSASFADRRSYVWTYEYVTMPRGMVEVEYYNTLEYPDTTNPKVNTWKHWVELEYGLTDNWDVSMYQTFKQTNTAAANTLSYDGFKLRTRYRLGERGSNPVDMLLYAELIEPNDLSKAGVFEGKVILAKDIRMLNFSYNYIIKRELTEAAKTENEFAAGASVELRPTFKIGLEAKGNYSTGKHYVGPTISWAQEKFWLNFGAVRGLGNGANDLQTRLLIGINI